MEFHEIIDVEETPRTKDVYTNCSFESLMISSSTIENMYKHGFRTPSPVQQKAIPAGLTGLDLLVQSNDPQKIIIVPTREIASQIKDTVKKIAHFKTRIGYYNVQLIGIKQYAVVMYQPVLNSLEHLLKSIQFNQALVFCNNHQAGLLVTDDSVQMDTSTLVASQRLLVSIVLGSCVDRDNVIEQLKRYKLKVLVSTDLTARGIDAENVNLVVNLEAAIDPETYFHRIGRAARYGGYGAAVTLLQDEKSLKCFTALVRSGKADVRVLSLTNIPLDLTTNQTFYDTSAPFTVRIVNFSLIGYCFVSVIFISCLGWIHYVLVLKINLKSVFQLSKVNCFAKDLQQLVEQINEQKSSVLSKIDSGNSSSTSEEKLKKYKFDLIQEPFLNTVMSSNYPFKEKLQMGLIKSNEKIQGLEQQTVKRSIDCAPEIRKYTRKDMIALQMKVPKTSYIYIYICHDSIMILRYYGIYAFEDFMRFVAF
uniref:ATP-dependent RNA helicase n=1 Tax=Heterorhabditis bacteriophora TaxID=37862 RepID=A0A1I7W7X3_HETBA